MAIRRAADIVREFGRRMEELGVDHYAIIVRDPDALTDHIRTDGGTVWLMGAGMEITEGAKDERNAVYEDSDDDEDTLETEG